MPISQSEFDAFKAYVDEPAAHRERECQGYLIYAATLLLPRAPSEILRVTEERNYFGTADFIIGADIKDGTNSTARHAFIWELKAPQCHLFEMDTNNRCRPTAEFLNAENQLLHYYHEASGNGRFRERMGVVDQDNIHMGGLVIGTRARLLRGSDQTAKADLALKVREKYFYKNYQIKIWTWDSILDFVSP